MVLTMQLGHRRHGVWIAIEYSYKLGQKYKLKFLCEHGWFLQRQSHITMKINYVFVITDTVYTPWLW